MFIKYFNVLKISKLALVGFFLSSSYYSTAFGMQTGSEVELEVHNVGQGNCITVKVKRPNEDAYDYMIVDAGANSFKKEAEIREKIKNYTKDDIKKMKVKKEQKKQTKKNISPGTSPGASSESSSSSKSFVVGNQIYPSHFKGSDIIAKEIVANIKKKLFREESEAKSKINLKTIVITHADSDHYNLYDKLLMGDSGEYRRVEYLILGGPQSSYFTDKSDKKSDKGKLARLIESLKEAGTKVYFTGSGEYVDPSQLTPEKYLPPFYSLSEAQKNKGVTDTVFQPFKDAFKFANDKFKVSYLGTNVLHRQGKGGVLRKTEKPTQFEDPEDQVRDRESRYNMYNNTDSIVLKIQYGANSAILTGDATGITNEEILDNYSDDPTFLHADVYVPEHHGSSSHGSNRKELIQAIKPKYILFSNGVMYKHPYHDAYQTCLGSERLESRRKKHVVLFRGINNKTKFLKDGYDIHYTGKGIYSTLSNGDIKVNFFGDKIDVFSEDDLVLPSIESMSLLPSPIKHEEEKLKEEKSLSDEEEIIINTSYDEELNELITNFSFEEESKKEEIIIDEERE